MEIKKSAGALLDRCQYLWMGIGDERVLPLKLVFSTQVLSVHLFLFKGRPKLCACGELPHIQQFLARQAIDLLLTVRRHFSLQVLAIVSL